MFSMSSSDENPCHSLPSRGISSCGTSARQTVRDVSNLRIKLRLGMRLRSTWRKTAFRQSHGFQQYLLILPEEISKHFDWRALAFFGAALFRALFAQNRDAQVPNLTVDFAEGRLGELVGRRQVFLESHDAFQSAIDLIARQRAKNPMHGFDLWNPVTDHGQIIPGRDGESN